MAVQSNTTSAPLLPPLHPKSLTSIARNCRWHTRRRHDCALVSHPRHFQRAALRYTQFAGQRSFHRGIALDRPETLSVSIEMVLLYTWVHGMVFCVIGGLASKLLALAERNLDLGFGILLLFVIFEFGFVGAAFIFAEPVLHALTWPAILIGNLMAAAVMAAYFSSRRPSLSIEP